MIFMIDDSAISQFKSAMAVIFLTLACANLAYANSCREVVESDNGKQESSYKIRFGHSQKDIISHSNLELAEILRTLSRRGVRSQIETSNGQSVIVITPSAESDMNRFAAKQFAERNGLKLVVAPVVFSIFPDAGAAYHRNYEQLIPLNRNLNPDMMWLESGLPDHSMILSKEQVDNFDPNAPIILHEIDHAGLNVNLTNKRPTIANIKAVSGNEAAQKSFYSGNYTAEEAFVVANDLIRARDGLKKLNISKFHGFASGAEVAGGTTVAPTTPQQHNLFLLTYAEQGIRHSAAGVEVAKEAVESLYAGSHAEFKVVNSITWAVLLIQSSTSKRQYQLAVPLTESTGSQDPKNSSLLFSQLKLLETINQDLKVLSTWVYQTLRQFQSNPNLSSAYPTFVNSIQLPLKPYEQGYVPYSIESLNQMLSSALK